MKILVTGAGGQLGQELLETAPSIHDVVARGLADLDITDFEAVDREVADGAPDWIINAAAYTAVDRAEKERDLAFGVNAEGARNVGLAAMAHGARLIHISTDFVFDGLAGRPYQPEDPPNPQSAYGASKLRGEDFIIEETEGSALIFRTAWLYSRFGANFVTGMLERMVGGQSLRVVDDQVGTPTWARGLAQALWKATDTSRLQGLLHWTDAGVASWYDFAVAIQEEALDLGLLDRPVEIQPIASSDYPTPAKRPQYSVLDKGVTWAGLGLRPVHWRQALRAMLMELKEARIA